MGGLPIGDSNLVRKSYAQQARTYQINLTKHKDKIPPLLNDLIIFAEDEARNLWHPHKDAIVVTLCIAGQKVYWILIDNGSYANILFKLTLNMMNLIKAKIEPMTSSLSR